MNEMGQMFIFPDLIDIRNGDVQQARNLGITPQEAAARRVCLHEWTHWSFAGLDSTHQEQLTDWAKANSSRREIQSVFDRYKRHKNELEERRYLLRVYEERLAEIVGATGKWPPAHQDGGMWEKDRKSTRLNSSHT